MLLKRTSLPSAHSNGIFWALTAESRPGGRAGEGLLQDGASRLQPPPPPILLSNLISP